MRFKIKCKIDYTYFSAYLLFLLLKYLIQIFFIYRKHNIFLLIISFIILYIFINKYEIS